MKTYTTIQGDMFDRIAKTVYGDEKRMDALLEANPGHIGTVVFPAGVALNIPDLPTASADTGGLPPWRARP